MNRRFWAAVGVQVAILLSMVALHGYTLMTGQPVALKAASLAPWDPFRGAYIDLGYEIGQLESRLPMAGAPYERGQRVWVTLRPSIWYWAAVAVSDQKPAAGENEVILRGRVEWVEPDRIHVRYGIEQFYVPEGQRRELEGRMVEMVIQAVVDRTGRAAIRTVYLDGKPIDWRP